MLIVPRDWSSVASSTTVQSLARHGLADLAGVVARALAVEVGLEPVAHRLVKEDAAVAGREHHVHLAGGGLACVEHQHRLPRRLARVPLRRLVVEVAHRHPPAAAARSVLPLAVALGHRAHAEAEHRLHVVDHRPFAGGDEDLADLFREAGLGLDDVAVVREHGRARPLQERSLGGAGHVERDPVELCSGEG